MVSEVMLQQTQVDRVVPKYHAFLERFPSIRSLADAAPADVIRAWSGLGYNRRALNLQRTARAVMDDHDGTMPRDVVALRRLPGIGAYTAGAIACFAYRQDVGFVDTNIRRVLHRVVAGPEVPEPRMTARDIERLADEVVPPGEGYEWNQALMELGATICRARSVACERCPLEAVCAARPTIEQVLASQPRRSGRTEPRFESTNRYLRGRIIAILRDAPLAGLTETEILDRMPNGSGRPDVARIVSLLDALAAEGMIDVDRAVAEAAPSYDGRPLSSTRRYRLPH